MHVHETMEGERHRQTAMARAFFGHLTDLAVERDRLPDLAAGDTTISVPAYFSLDDFAGPVNQATLDILPRATRSPMYGDVSTPHTIHDDNLRAFLRIPTDRLEAARRGESLNHTIAEALGLLASEPRLAYGIRVRPSDGPRTELSDYLDALRQGGEIAMDELRAGIVGPVSEIATRMRAAGHTDFLDYLVGTRALILERVWQATDRVRPTGSNASTGN